MADYSIEPRNDAVFGMTGSGKTTFVIRLMLNTPAVCRFIFDDENRTAPRLRLKPCYTLRECEEALLTRWVVFNPDRMFAPRDGDRSLFDSKRRAFRWFCGWIFEVCKRGPGNKIISLPEIWRFCTADSIPPEFAQLMQMGRELNTHVIVDTQRPDLVNESIIGQTTELICFKLNAPDALHSVKKLKPDAACVGLDDFPLGRFVAYNRLTGGRLCGRVF